MLTADLDGLKDERQAGGRENDFGAHLVVLEDPENNFAAQNVIPVLRTSKQSDKLTQVLDAVSAQITTEELIALNTSVSGDQKVEPAAAATAWVKDKGLDQPVS